MSKHTEDKALKSLQRKHDVKINVNDKTIFINRGTNKKNDLGNKSHGKIEFLKNILNYKVIATTKF